MKIQILPSARKDLVRGYHFYQRQQGGLGHYFLDCLYEDIERLATQGGIHAVSFGGFHRLLCKRFPFAVFYRLEGNTVQVYAVLDCRQDPDFIRRRLLPQE